MRIEAQVSIPSDPALHAVPRRMFRECAMAVGLDEKHVNRLELAVGEALANITRHCYQGACDRPITVTCVATPEQIELCLGDRGPCVNPASLPNQPTPGLEPGGLGLHFIRQIMTEVRFEQCPDGGNLLYLTYRIEPPSASSTTSGNSL